jgi:RNA recognition motif. (a.k.a. RRM, RBD, or RNP domain)
MDYAGFERRSSQWGQESQDGKLFVGGISWETTNETLSQYFSRFGQVSDAHVAQDRQTQKPRGFAFVSFVERDVAAGVLHLPHTIDNRKVRDIFAGPVLKSVLKPLSFYLMLSLLCLGGSKMGRTEACHGVGQQASS